MIAPVTASLAGATPLAKAAAECVLTCAWQGTLLVAAVTFLLRPLRGMSATARFFLWSAVSALLLLMPLRQIHLASQQASSGSSSGLHLALPMFLAWVFAVAWTLLSLYRATQLLRSARHVLRVAREAQPLSPEQRGLFDLPSTTLDLIATSNLVDVPCVAGFHAPKVLLPFGLIESMAPVELAQVVRHELEHVRRADQWLNLLQKLLLTLFPLNPGLWWAERKLCAERELACDDSVLAETNAPADYALSLANLAELSLARRSASLMLGAWRKRSELSIRIHRILSSRPRWRNASTIASVAVLTLTIAGAADLLNRAPTVMSFASPTTTAHAAPLAVTVAENTTPVMPIVAIRPTKKLQRTAHLNPSSKPAMPDATLPTVAVAEQPQTAQQELASNTKPKVQLAAYKQTAGKAPHAQPVLFDDGQHTYAAFHLADGWLLIQL